MRWGRVVIGADFLLVVALALYLDTQGVVAVALLACAIHELGHLIALYGMGGQLNSLRLSWVGAEMKVTGHLGYGGEFVLALAGPLVNVMTAIAGTYWGEFPLLCGISVSLALLNLLPVQRLDGGKAIFALCSGLWGWERGQRVGEWFEQITGILLLVMGGVTMAIGGSFTLLLLAIWVLWGRKNQKISKKTLA